MALEVTDAGRVIAVVDNPAPCVEVIRRLEELLAEHPGCTLRARNSWPKKQSDDESRRRKALVRQAEKNVGSLREITRRLGVTAFGQVWRWKNNPATPVPDWVIPDLERLAAEEPAERQVD